MSGSRDKIKLFSTGSGERVAEQPPNFKRGSRWKNLLKELVSWG